MPHSTILDRPFAVDLAYLESSAFGQSDFVLRAIDILLDQLPEQVLDLNRAFSEKDWLRVRMTAHKLKSAAGLLGMEPLKRTLRLIETVESVDLGCLKDLEVWIDEVTCICIRALEELQVERYRFA